MLHSYIPFQSKEVVQLIHQSSANTAPVRHPCAAKTDMNYAEGLVTIKKRNQGPSFGTIRRIDT
jgi:hypothetical protein